MVEARLVTRLSHAVTDVEGDETRFEEEKFEFELELQY